MKTQGLSSHVFVLLLLICTIVPGPAQTPPKKEISVYQYRKVSPDKMDEFIKRETTYWSEVAKKAMEKGNITFWAMLEKVGGKEDEPNILFINTYRDVDEAGSVWNSVNTIFPKIPAAQMETNSISKTVASYFLSAQGWEQKDKSAMTDQKYAVIIYHQSTNPGSLVELEKKHWAPFIKTAMNNGQTTQVAWGNAFLLDPIEYGMKFNSVFV